MIGATCTRCGSFLPELPLCYGADAPWRELGVPEAEIEKRVALTADQCVSVREITHDVSEDKRGLRENTSRAM
jgi:hypothetical protein